MKRQLAIILFMGLFAAFVFSSMLIVGGCGGGGGGDGGVIGGLATGTFIKTPDYTDQGNNFFPFNDSFDSQILQQLYLASEVNGAGYINKISFRLGADLGAPVDCPNCTVKLGHTSLADLTTTFANNVEEGRGSQITVIDNATITIPAGSSGDYFDIALDTPFHYNGVDNLVVEISRTSACTGEVIIDTDDMGASNRQLNAQPIAPTGSLWPYQRLTKFHFAGGDNAIIPTAGITGSNIFPFNTNPAAGRKVQLLYSAGAIDGSGPITGIGMIVNLATTEQEYTMTVRLGHSTLTDLTTTYDNNFSDTPVTVASGVVFKVPAGVPAGETVWFPLPDGAFTYNGLDNLIVEIDVIDNSSATGNTSWRENFPVVNDVRLFGDTGVATGTVDEGGYHIEFRFNGGTMDVLTPDGMTSGWGDAFPFFTADGRRQWLYRAAELGTKGTINKIACRAWILGGAADTGFTYTVIMGHTTATTLGTDFAANLPSPVTVFNGTLNIPAVSGGDWYEIPLSTSFNYNGTDNLVVEIGGTGGTGVGAACILDNVNTTLYTSRRLWAPVSTDATGGLADSLIDMRFTLK